MADVKVAGSLIPGIADTPLDKRTRISSLDQLSSVENPYIGMPLYCLADGRRYVVKTLKAKKIGALTVPNAMIDTAERVPDMDDLPSAGSGTAASTLSLPVPFDEDGHNLTLVVDFSLTGEFNDADAASAVPATYTRVTMAAHYAKMRVFSNGAWEALTAPSLGIPFYGANVEFTLDTEMFPGYVPGTKYYARYRWLDSAGGSDDWTGFAFRNDVADMRPVQTGDKTPLHVLEAGSKSGELAFDYLNGEVQNISLADEAVIRLGNVSNVSFGEALIINVNTNGHELKVYNDAKVYNCTENKTYMVVVSNFGVLNIAVTETI